MVASVEIAIENSKTPGRPFAQAKRELTSEYLARKTGWSQRTVVDAMADATLLGFFERLDDGNGGKRNAAGVGTNRATYRPRVPSYFVLPDRANPAPHT